MIVNLAIDDVSTNIEPAEYTDMYEVRAYTLSNISSKTKAYRIRNLKRQQARPTYVRSFDQKDKTWVLNYINYTKYTDSVSDIEIPHSMLNVWTRFLQITPLNDVTWRRDIIVRFHGVEKWQKYRLIDILALLQDPSQEVTIDQLLYYARSLQLVPDTQQGKSEIRSSSPLNIGLDDDAWSVNAEAGDFNFSYNPRPFAIHLF